MRFYGTISDMAPRCKSELERALRRAYRGQKSRAKGRGIAFLFTFEQWSEWWLTDDRWSRRGRKGGQLVMARHGDAGPYAPDNVACISPNQNSRDHIMTPEHRAAFRALPRRLRGHSNLAIFGARHPRARAVVTPTRTYRCAAEAARAFEISRQYAAWLARTKSDGWRYADDAFA